MENVLCERPWADTNVNQTCWESPQYLVSLSSLTTNPVPPESAGLKRKLGIVYRGIPAPPTPGHGFHPPLPRGEVRTLTCERAATLQGGGLQCVHRLNHAGHRNGVARLGPGRWKVTITPWNRPRGPPKQVKGPGRARPSLSGSGEE